MSVFTWRKVVAEAEGRLTIISDAFGVLHDALKFRAKDATLNPLLADTALILAPMGLQVSWAQVLSSLEAALAVVTGLVSFCALSGHRRTGESYPGGGAGHLARYKTR